MEEEGTWQAHGQHFATLPEQSSVLAANAQLFVGARGYSGEFFTLYENSSNELYLLSFNPQANGSDWVLLPGGNVDESAGSLERATSMCNSDKVMLSTLTRQLQGAPDSNQVHYQGWSSSWLLFHASCGWGNNLFLPVTCRIIHVC